MLSALLLTLMIGPLQTAGERQAAQLGSDATLGTAMGLDVWSAWQAPNRKAALGCAAGKYATGEAIGLAGQHWITSPRPDGSGDGMPSLHAIESSAGIMSSQRPWLNAVLAAATDAGRYFGARHTFKQVAVGSAIGFGLSFWRCGGS